MTKLYNLLTVNTFDIEALIVNAQFKKLIVTFNKVIKYNAYFKSFIFITIFYLILYLDLS